MQDNIIRNYYDKIKMITRMLTFDKNKITKERIDDINKFEIELMNKNK